MMLKKGIARAAAACAGMMLAGAACATQPVAVKAETVSGGRYGPVTVTKPSGPLRGFVVLFSREAGWNAADQQAADALAKAGAMTVGVDSERYAMNLAAKQEACHHLDGDAEAVSHQLERLAQSSRYFTPIVAGVGGNAGTQTLAVTVRALATNQLTRSNTLRAVGREFRVALLNGGTIAVVIDGVRS